MMQPYINPNYFNQPQFQPYTPPYMNQQPNYQPPQQTTVNQPQMNTLGKVVDSVDVVKATEIPMDGSTYYFPKADGSIVYSKQWLPNGTTKIGAFLPQKEDLEPKADNSIPNDVNALLGGITDEIRALQDEVHNLADGLKPTGKTRKSASNESNAND